MSLGDMMTLFKIRRGSYAVVEEKVPAGAKAIGVPLKDMDLAEHCVIAAIIRDGKMTLPRGESTLQPEDEIIAVASPEGAQKLAESAGISRVSHEEWKENGINIIPKDTRCVVWFMATKSNRN